MIKCVLHTSSFCSRMARIPIITHDIRTASKMMRVHFSPAGNSSVHMEHIIQKGLDWVDCLHTKPVSRSNSWLISICNCILGFCGVWWQCACILKNWTGKSNGSTERFFLFLKSIVRSRGKGRPCPKDIRDSVCKIYPWRH
jgi:hypothetical protein